MTPERYQRLEQLYHAALEAEPESRANFLDGACGSDEELRREVELLLAAHDKVGNYFASPALELAAGLVAKQENLSLMGRRLSHYRVLRLIGAGGMGEVYLAEDTSLGRRVALKLLPGHLSQDADRLRRFEREARAASSLNHPNVCVIHEVGETDDRCRYIVMEYIEGVTLRRHMTGRRMGLTEVLDVAIQISSALSAAHEVGVVHRDIKPDNVMLRPDGIIKVLDFGLAKLTEQQLAADSAVQTGAGLVMGTARYMSPEQARGLAVDARTDIWSLGVVLYEMATGRAPFEGATTSDMIAALLTADPPPLRQYCAGATAELERIAGKCLAKGRETRYQSAKELSTELKTLQTASQAKEAAGLHSIGGAGARRESRRWLLIATMAALLIVAGLVWFLFSRRAPTIQPDRIESLVVLPLENLSGDPSQEYFADGMTDALIGELAKIGALRVISRTSTMYYKGAKKTLPEIARELNVEAVVEGTVLRSGDRVQVRVQLIRAAGDQHIWSETYDYDLRDVLALQSDVARAITREIQAKVTSAEQVRLARNRSVNRKALDDYLQGYYYLDHRTEESLRQAIEYFQSAIREDPTYAPAYAGLASCYNRLSLVVIGALLPTEARRRAEEAAWKALELDSELAEAHAALGYVKHYNWDWDAAEQALKRAIELNPNYADAHSIYAHYLSTRGRAEEAIAEANRAQELDPLSLTFSVGRGFLLTNARRYDEAIEQLRRVIAVDPNHYMAHWFLAFAYAAKGQFDEAIATSEKAVALSSRAPGALGLLGMSYGLAGRKGEANKVLNELLELDRHRYVTPVAVVNVYIGLGNKDQAFAWLEKAYQERSNYMAYLKVFPLVDPLRSDPKLDDLLRRIRLSP